MKEFKYTINGNPYRVEVIKEEDDSVELKVNGTPYTVVLERPHKSKPKITKPAAPPVTPSGAPVIAQQKYTGPGGILRSPLPGIILDVLVKVGDTVKVGDKVLILEAMKMENTIVSEFSGQVKEIKVNKGDSVLEGAELVIIG